MTENARVLTYETAKAVHLAISESREFTDLQYDWAYDYNVETKKAELIYYGRLKSEGYPAYYVADVLEFFYDEGVHIWIEQLTKLCDDGYNINDGIRGHVKVLANKPLQKLFEEKFGDYIELPYCLSIWELYDIVIRKVADIYGEYLEKENERYEEFYCQREDIENQIKELEKLKKTLTNIKENSLADE